MASYNNDAYYVINLFVSYWPPPMIRDTVLVTIVAGRRARIGLTQRIEITFYFDLWILLNRFDGGIGTSMRKAAHPSGGMGSSNPRRWRGERLHHHGDRVC